MITYIQHRVTTHMSVDYRNGVHTVLKGRSSSMAVRSGLSWPDDDLLSWTQSSHSVWLIWAPPIRVITSRTVLMTYLVMQGASALSLCYSSQTFVQYKPSNGEKSFTWSELIQKQPQVSFCGCRAGGGGETGCQLLFFFWCCWYCVCSPESMQLMFGTKRSRKFGTKAKSREE